MLNITPPNCCQGSASSETRHFRKSRWAVYCNKGIPGRDETRAMRSLSSEDRVLKGELISFVGPLVRRTEVTAELLASIHIVSELGARHW